MLLLWSKEYKLDFTSCKNAFVFQKSLSLEISLKIWKEASLLTASILNAERRCKKKRSCINSGGLKENPYYRVHQFLCTKEAGKCWDERRAGSSLYITSCPDTKQRLELTEQPHSNRPACLHANSREIPFEALKPLMSHANEASL